MTAWADRPAEEARLLNPAFLAALIAAAARDYQNRGSRPMPWLLSFLLLPLILQARAREALPGTIVSHLPNWVQEHAEIRIGFPRRAAGLVPLVREALRFGIRNEMLSMDGPGLTAIANPNPQGGTEEVQDCFRAARFVGRWFARDQDVMTLYRLFGIRP